MQSSLAFKKQFVCKKQFKFVFQKQFSLAFKKQFICKKQLSLAF